MARRINEAGLDDRKAMYLAVLYEVQRRVPPEE